MRFASSSSASGSAISKASASVEIAKGTLVRGWLDGRRNELLVALHELLQAAGGRRPDRKSADRCWLPFSGQLLDSDEAALIVIGESSRSSFNKVLDRAVKAGEKEIDADAGDLKRELEAAAKEAAASQ